ncbi:sigma-70 family RNA polymerase sigma factor [Candidatus Woesearchaeota archaeon]|nr:sigma-70 family RNA polymerase sigma factor [Candidatus Woesearchaeota archaeon]
MTAAYKKAAGAEEFSTDIEDPFTLSAIKNRFREYSRLEEQGDIALETRLTDYQLEQIISNRSKPKAFVGEDSISIAERILRDIKEYESSTKRRFPQKALYEYGWDKAGLEWHAATAGSLEYADKLDKREKDMDDFRLYKKWLDDNPVKYRRLSDKEQKAVLEMIDTGNTLARRELLKHNLRLGPYVVNRIKCDDISRMQLLEWANEVMIRCADRYDPRRGAFSTYLYRSLMYELPKKIRQHREVVAVPQHMFEEFKEMRRFVNFFIAGNGRSPTVVEIVNKLGWSEKNVKKVLTLYNLNKRSVLELENFIKSAPDRAAEIFEAKECSDAVNRLLDHLKPKEQRVLKLRYGIVPPPGMRTLEEVGKILKVTRERVRQIEKVAVYKIKHNPFLRIYVQDFLDDN